MKDLIVIFIGGAVGTALRASLEIFESGVTWPWITFCLNISGAFVLGLLLEVLTRSGSDNGWRRKVRLTFGTGLLGSFTTYSALAWQYWTLGIWGIGYVVCSVIAGVLAAWVGIILAERMVHR